LDIVFQRIFNAIGQIPLSRLFLCRKSGNGYYQQADIEIF